MKVYVVISGCYSERTIEKVFIEKDKAKYYVQLHQNMDNIHIEEFETHDDNVLIQSTNNISYYEVVFNPEGQVLCVSEEKTFTEIPSENIFFDNSVITLGNGTQEMMVKVKADNIDSAIKIARDTRVQWLSEKYGL